MSDDHNNSFYKSTKCKERFKLGKEIGRGTFGRVYQARYRSPNGPGREKLAVKVFRSGKNPTEEKIAEDLFDGLAGSYLYHKKCQVVKVREAYRCTESSQFSFAIVMDYIDGVSLKQYVQSQSEIPLTIKFDLTEKLLKGFICLHSHKIYHRDIKLDNVMITTEGSGGSGGGSIKSVGDNEIKIIDFGLSCAAHAKDFRKFVTDNVGPEMEKLIMNFACEVGPVGTPLYQPPEELLHFLDGGDMNFIPFLELKDAYALGCLLYEMWALDGHEILPQYKALESLKNHYNDLIGQGKTHNLISSNLAPSKLIDMISQLMDIRYDKRITIVEAYEMFERDRYDNLQFVLHGIHSNSPGTDSKPEGASSSVRVKSINKSPLYITIPDIDDVNVNKLNLNYSNSLDRYASQDNSWKQIIVLGTSGVKLLFLLNDLSGNKYDKIQTMIGSSVFFELEVDQGIISLIGLQSPPNEKWKSLIEEYKNDSDGIVFIINAGLFKESIDIITFASKYPKSYIINIGKSDPVLQQLEYSNRDNYLEVEPSQLRDTLVDMVYD